MAAEGATTDAAHREVPEAGTYVEGGGMHHHTKPHTSASECDWHPPHLSIATLHLPLPHAAHPPKAPKAPKAANGDMGHAHDPVIRMAWDRPCDVRAHEEALYYLRGDHRQPSPTADAAAEEVEAALEVLQRCERAQHAFGNCGILLQTEALATLRRLESPAAPLPLGVQRNQLSEKMVALARGPDAPLAVLAQSLCQQWLGQLLTHVNSLSRPLPPPPPPPTRDSPPATPAKPRPSTKSKLPLPSQNAGDSGSEQPRRSTRTRRAPPRSVEDRRSYSLRRDAQLHATSSASSGQAPPLPQLPHNAVPKTAAFQLPEALVAHPTVPDAKATPSKLHVAQKPALSRPKHSHLSPAVMSHLAVNTTAAAASQSPATPMPPPKRKMPKPVKPMHVLRARPGRGSKRAAAVVADGVAAPSSPSSSASPSKRTKGPSVGKGHKLCDQCNEIIGSPCKTCPHCGHKIPYKLGV